ncbi:hypothetical protein QE152_g15589 [Popillia japonica]|uniref:Uncharacterized protein n=1 Tax=Popillia japonica TaxID=7064 RepID=A0AAW1L7V3_POPJA
MFPAVAPLIVAFAKNLVPSILYSLVPTFNLTFTMCFTPYRLVTMMCADPVCLTFVNVFAILRRIRIWNVKWYLDLDSSTENEVQNEQFNATSETSPDQESINRESSVSSEDMEDAFISRGKVTSSGKVTKPPQRLDL